MEVVVGEKYFWGGYIISFSAVSAVLLFGGDYYGGCMLYDVVADQQLQLMPLTSKVCAELRKARKQFQDLIVSSLTPRSLSGLAISCWQPCFVAGLAHNPEFPNSTWGVNTDARQVVIRWCRPAALPVT
jgi:hypothetical protein